jgi:hypothetical protein
VRACGARSSRLRTASQSINEKPIRSIVSSCCCAPQSLRGGRTSPRATAAYQTILELGAGAQAGPHTTLGGLSGCPRARESDGWMVRTLFLDIDSAYGVARAAAAGIDGIAAGIQILIKRLHESDRLKSTDERREKLKIRRVVDGRRLEVLHLPAEVLEHSIVEKPAQSAH